MSTELYHLCCNAQICKGSDVSLKRIEKWLIDNAGNPNLLKESASYKDYSNNMAPIHWLLWAAPSPDLLELFIKIAPETVKLQDSNGLLPLHYACRYKPSLDIVRMLLESYPRGAKVRDNYGNLPLSVRDDHGMLCLHHACHTGAPTKLLQLLVQAYPEACTQADHEGKRPWQILRENGAAARVDRVGGMFPLHHACRDGASLEFLKLLLDAYPECISKRDMTDNTPSQLLKESRAAEEKDENRNTTLLLHRACFKEFCNEGSVRHLQKILKLLIEANPKGIEEPDEQGMIPLHHACANADSKEVLECLVHTLAGESPNVQKKDKLGRTSLHVLLQRVEVRNVANRLEQVQRDRKLSTEVALLVESGVIEYLVARGAESYVKDDANDPLSYAEQLFTEEFKHVTDRLELYLQLKPKANTKFYVNLQSVSDQEREDAVLEKYVQQTLNEAVCKWFPTFILMLDFYFIVAVIVCYGIAVPRYNSYLFNNTEGSACWSISCTHPRFKVFPATMLCGGAYFFLREALQIISLASAKQTKAYFFNPVNSLEQFCIVIMICFATVMLTGAINRKSSEGSREAFRSLASLCSGILFILVFNFLKRISREFSVFVQGVQNVIRRLITFLVALIIILVAFALMFFAVFSGSTECSTTTNSEISPTASSFPFCTFGTSVLEVYSIMFGNYDPSTFHAESEESGAEIYVAISLYFLLGFLVIIVLFNVLIAIVWESYSIIKNEDADELFWSNRLEFATEVKVISKWLKNLCKWAEKIFDDKRFQDEHGNLGSSKFWPYLAIRLIVIFFIPIWFLLGLVTVGLLWPPQVRKWACNHRSFEAEFETAWINVTKIYEDQILKGDGTKFWPYLLPRVLGALVIPLWLLLGFVTAGLLWPPQVRKWLWGGGQSKKQIKGSANLGTSNDTVTQNMTEPSDIQFDLITEMSQLLAANERKFSIEISELKEKMASDISKAKSDIIKQITENVAQLLLKG